MRHLVLTGPMGSGKTTVGRLLAGRLGRRFIDSDEQIEGSLAMSGRELTERKGVERLHAVEERMLHVALAEDEAAVIAAAASVADSREAVEALAGSGAFLVLLTGDTAVLQERARSGGHRRLVDAGVAADASQRRQAQLRPVADVVVDVTDADPDEVAAAVIRALR